MYIIHPPPASLHNYPPKHPQPHVAVYIVVIRPALNAKQSDLIRKIIIDIHKTNLITNVDV